jgi:HAD superfamily hydrolase (TIGR01509 family)
MNGNPRGVIFDMDGVLVSSGECHRAAFVQVLEQLGVNDFDYPPYAGRRTPDVIEDVLRQRGRASTPEIVASAALEKTRLARLKFDQLKPLNPEYGQVLAKVAARYPLAFASSGSRASVEAFFKLSGSRSLFRSVLSGEDVTDAKPNPEIYLRSASELGIQPSDCLVVEDAVAGVQAALAASASPIGVSGTTTADRLYQAGAETVISNLAELPKLLKTGQIDREKWTAIIPAAGRGSRLGFHRPKILFPVGGRLILDWLLDFLEPVCSALVFVVSPDGAAEIESELDLRIPGRYALALQETPTGMGDAVALGLTRVRTEHTAIVWGDQVALRRESVETCLALHQGVLTPDVTCPTVLRENPYIHFERDDQGRLVGLRQAREGDAMPETGESDTGFFCFRSAKLAELLEAMRQDGSGRGAATGESNLLPAIVRAAAGGEGNRVLTPRHMRAEETVGINSARDAALVESFLETSHDCRI